MAEQKPWYHYPDAMRAYQAGDYHAAAVHERLDEAAKESARQAAKEAADKEREKAERREIFLNSMPPYKRTEWLENEKRELEAQRKADERYGANLIYMTCATAAAFGGGAITSISLEFSETYSIPAMTLLCGSVGAAFCSRNIQNRAVKAAAWTTAVTVAAAFFGVAGYAYLSKKASEQADQMGDSTTFPNSHHTYGLVYALREEAGAPPQLAKDFAAEVKDVLWFSQYRQDQIEPDKIALRQTVAGETYQIAGEVYTSFGSPYLSFGNTHIEVSGAGKTYSLTAAYNQKFSNPKLLCEGQAGSCGRYTDKVVNEWRDEKGWPVVNYLPEVPAAKKKPASSEKKLVP